MKTRHHNTPSDAANDRTTKLALHVYACNSDPFFRCLRAKTAGIGVVIGVVVALLSVVLVVNKLQGTLTHPDGWSIVLRDLEAIFLRTSSASANTDFPLQRDVASIIVLVLMGINVPVVYRQWILIEEFLPELRDHKVLRLKSDDSRVRAKFTQDLDKLNDRFVRAGAGWYWILGTVLALILVISEKQLGIFSALAPHGLSPDGVMAWTNKAYAKWWANFDTNSVGFAVYFLSAMFIFRYVIAQNHVGVHVVKFFWDHRNQFDFKMKSSLKRHVYGWDHARRLLWTVYVSVLLNAVSLLCLLQIIPAPLKSHLLQSIWAVLLLGLMSLAPLYILGPYFIVRPKLAAFKRDQLSLKEARLRELPDIDDANERESQEITRLNDQIERLKEMPTFPIRLPALTMVTLTWATFGIQVIQTIVAILQR